MKNEKKFTIADLWYTFLALALPVICVSGASPIPFALRPYLIYATGIGFVLAFIFSGIKIRLNSVTVLGFLLVSYMSISLFYSYDAAATKSLMFIYICSFTLLFTDMPTDKFELVLKICYVLCIVMAFSIIISVFINNCMLRFFSFIVNPLHSPSITAAIQRELSEGTYSGFVRERTDAAFVMNVGIAISYSKFFSQGKLKKLDVFFLAIFIIAMIFTGKRMLFVVSVICFAIFMLISNIKNRFFKTSVIVLLAVSLVFMASMFVPQVSSFLSRFLDSENLSTIGQRDMLWNSMISMFKSNPVFGAGLNSFNSYAYNHGLLVGNREWTYNGHNSYLQFLAELGVVGFAILVMFIAVAFYTSIKLLKAVRDNRLYSKIVYFSVYIQVLIAVYALTGNPLYSRQMVVMWFLSIGMVNSIYYKLNPVTEKRMFGRKERLYGIE